MAIFGPGPADNDNGSSAIAVSLRLIVDRIENGLALLPEKKPTEPGVLGYVACVRLIAQAYPQEADLTIRRAEVDDWKTQYFDWFERTEKKFPAKYRAGMRKAAESEFSLLGELLG